MTLQLLNPVLSCHVTAEILRCSISFAWCTDYAFPVIFQNQFVEHTMGKKRRGNVLFTARLQHSDISKVQ